jgi:predicted RNase H-like HicB family nuclease
MAQHTYIAEFEPAPEGGYGIHFPDLPGCTSFADDLGQAISQATDALTLHLGGMIEEGEALPQQTQLAELVLSDDRAPDGVWAAITAEVEDAAERVNVYLPKSLLAQIERFGQETGIDNRSTFFRLAARSLLNRESRGKSAGAEKLERIASGLPDNEKAHKAAGGA